MHISTFFPPLRPHLSSTFFVCFIYKYIYIHIFFNTVPGLFNQFAAWKLFKSVALVLLLLFCVDLQKLFMVSEAHPAFYKGNCKTMKGADAFLPSPYHHYHHLE